MYYVCFYTVADPSRIPEVYPLHSAFVDEFAEGGGIAMIGTFGDPLAEGSMCVFRSQEAAEDFLSRDPFVTQGVASPSPLRQWDPLEYDSNGTPLAG
ncbi:YciI family protein [Naasia sp. SYSU D00948]|uniref:YciI family protein n=1 Tax=Naasia sp. SYSU D00948 TaxID=2817379 RepID=UPI001B301392|nr:hypothetical protein [Naasia sp. SYSU D00948]